MESPYASPCFASDLTNLPRALFILAEYDLVLQEGQRYADQLKAAGVSVDVYTQPGVGHLAATERERLP